MSRLKRQIRHFVTSSCQQRKARNGWPLRFEKRCSDQLGLKRRLRIIPERTLYGKKSVRLPTLLAKLDGTSQSGASTRKVFFGSTADMTGLAISTIGTGPFISSQMRLIAWTAHGRKNGLKAATISRLDRRSGRDFGRWFVECLSWRNISELHRQLSSVPQSPAVGAQRRKRKVGSVLRSI